MEQALVAKRIGGVELGLYAHEHYLKAHGVPRSVEELSKHAIIGFDREHAFIRKFQEQCPALSRESLAFRTDSDLTSLAAIRAGFGIGVCQSALATRDKALVRIRRTKFAPKMDTWTAMHEDLRDSPRCAATFSALAAGLAAYMRSS